MSFQWNENIDIRFFILAYGILAVATIAFVSNIRQHYRLRKMWDRCRATISSISNGKDSYDGNQRSSSLGTYIDYTYRGISYYHMDFGCYKSSFKVGDRVTIYVNPNNPKEFINKENGHIFISFFIITVLFVALTYVFFKTKL